jgi:hypothetical protein
MAFMRVSTSVPKAISLAALADGVELVGCLLLLLLDM